MIKWLGKKRLVKIAINVFLSIAVYSLYADFFISRFYEAERPLGVSSS